MIYTIYKHTNTINGKSYIGFTSQSIEKRTREHLNKVTFGSKYHFHNAIRRWGWKSFRTEIIYQSNDHLDNGGVYTLNIMESHFIQENSTFGKRGYNSTPGGDGGMIGENNPAKKPEVRAKQRAAWTEERRLAQSKRMIGNSRKRGVLDNDETKQKKRLARMAEKNPMWGKKRPDTTLRNKIDNPSKHKTKVSSNV